ncbi:hypothetical protein BRYFOR_05517 [Marvinbryantia formatexigens DSM 14469]|uniref:Uncharacterized protein n=1 Tax=Marvinbryantia formatexigens DSM 14469 TaxID=478749 RepID=C6LA75_9FIRM|nr:hypothetical protein BRYFOR_05517 [Marvinbryantia formatexigens DSM 14469]
MIRELAFISPISAMGYLNNVRIKFLSWKIPFCVKIQKAYLNTIKKKIICNSTMSFTTIVNDHTVFILFDDLSLGPIPVRIIFSHNNASINSNQLILTIMPRITYMAGNRKK